MPFLECVSAVHRFRNKSAGIRYLHVVGLLVCCDGTGLYQILINSYQSDNVTTWYILNWLDVSSHHENGSVMLNDFVLEMLYE